MKNWKAPLTLAGKPCKRCRPGFVCPAHRSSREVPKKGGPRLKLDATVLDIIAEIAPTTTNHRPLWEAAGVRPATWFSWVDRGRTDQQEGTASIHRELVECLDGQRRSLAQDLRSAAVDSALGHYVIQSDPKTGKPVRVYTAPPNGPLAAKVASQLDSKEALPRDGVEVDHRGDGPAPVFHFNFDPSKIKKAADEED